MLDTHHLLLTEDLEEGKVISIQFMETREEALHIAECRNEMALNADVPLYCYTATVSTFQDSPESIQDQILRYIHHKTAVHKYAVLLS